jgi:predicted lipid carrier protein YhbT
MSATAETSVRSRRGLDAETLARLARRTPKPLLRAAVLPPTRRLVVREIFRRMPRQLKPSASIADAIIRWDITDERTGTADTWFLIFEDGRCVTTRRPPEANPRTTLTVSALDFLRLASGAAQPMAMFQSGRIKIAGDMFFAAQLQSMFAIPA